jgi:superfamily II DNA or RNA helicase
VSSAPPRLSVKTHYRSGLDDLGKDFFAPCLAASRAYRRASGYFSSGALATWAEGLQRLGRGREMKIRLIASPELPSGDREVLERLEDPNERARQQAVLVEQMMDDLVRLAGGDDDHATRVKVLAWLLATGSLEIRFAFPEHIEAAGLFHEKMGVFDLDDGGQIAFTGSANETARGHSRNYESVDVYRSWMPGESDRVATKVEQFDEAWDGEAAGLSVLAPSPEVLARLRSVGAPLPSSPAQPKLKKPPPVDPRWRHQDEAVEALLKARAGVLEMATGTGKTRTAIKLMSSLIDQGAIDSAIVTTDGTDLLEQWALELETWSLDQGRRWLVLRQFERYRQGNEYALGPSRAVIVVSRSQLRRVLDRITDRAKARTLIIHDEVHGLGTPSLVQALAGRHAAFGWRVGLSATPERTYDQDGNDFVRSELGPTVYEFPLERAISRGVLAEFDYLPLPYDLTAGDRARIQALYAKKAARLRAGNPMSNEEVWTEIARIYKTAEMKPDIYKDYLRDHPESLKRSIVFVETREYGEQVLDIVDEHTNRYRTYYADDDRDHLVEFAKGGIDCLITCHRISQGIDIQSLNSVVLFASARARLETVQRIGRCLRLDPARPGKRALVVDFVRPPQPGDTVPNADQDRAAWLTQLATTRRGDEDGPRRGA